MKQVTGSNSPASDNMVSIQLKLGGHSFSHTAPIENIPPQADVEFELLSPKTMLVPRELFEESKAATYLAANGMPCTDIECAVWSTTQAPIVAVIAFDISQIAAIRESLGSRARFTTPLLQEPQPRPVTWFHRNGNLLYIKVYTPELRFAEVVSIETDADLPYYAGLLNREFALSDSPVHITGEEQIATRKILRKYFKQLR